MRILLVALVSVLLSGHLFIAMLDLVAGSMQTGLDGGRKNGIATATTVASLDPNVSQRASTETADGFAADAVQAAGTANSPAEMRGDFEAAFASLTLEQRLAHFQNKIAALENQHAHAMALLSADPGGETGTPVASTPVDSLAASSPALAPPEIVPAVTTEVAHAAVPVMIGLWINWVSSGVERSISSGQWWNYAALMVCLTTGLMFALANATVGLDAIPLSKSAIAALSDWAINAPPILGVIGTIIAFAGFITGSGSAAISPDLFGRSFFDAAATTVVGGLIYVINLLLYASFARQIEA